MLRCEDNTIYTGITNDIDRRMNEHFNRTNKCAKYTLNHHAKKLEQTFKCSDKSDALKLEYRIKKLKKQDKENLIKDKKLINIFFKDILDTEKYF